MIRQGLRLLLDAQREFVVVGETDNGRDAVAFVRDKPVNVVVMDIHLPALNGIDATRQAMAVCPGLKVVCISADTTERVAVEALRADASAYVLKKSPFEELVVAIHAVVGDQVYLTPSIASVVTGDAKSAHGISATLSGREREVLQLISEGKATKEIAMCLSLSVKTAETHRRNLMMKLSIDSVAGLTKFAVREGLTTL